MGEGTPELRSERATTSPLQLHPLADAATLRSKLAKASLRGEGQGEGRFARSLRGPARRYFRANGPILASQ